MRKAINKIKTDKDLRKVAENSISLTVITFLNYGFPLFLIPYLTRVLGAGEYGIYAFTLAIANYFTLFVRFGFEFSATKQLALLREKTQEVHKLFSRVMTVRFLLMLTSLLLLTLLVLTIPKLNSIKTLLFLSVGVFVGNGLIPVWFFQGIENMKLITVISFISRLISTILIVIFVKSSNDTALAVGFQSVGFVVGAICSLVLVFYQYKLRFIIPQWKDIRLQVKEAWHLFLSNVGVNFYRESNVLILGALASYEFVGYYAAAEKLIKAIQSLLQPVIQALFPYFGRRLNNVASDKSNLLSFIKFGKAYALVLSCFAVLVVLLSPPAVRLVLGAEYLNSIVNIQVLSGVIIFGGLNYYYGIVGLVNLGYEKQFTRSVWLSGLISVIACVVFVHFYKDLGAAIVMTLVEGGLFILVMRLFKRHVLNHQGTVH